MKRVVVVSFIIFAFAWLFLSPTSVLAHECLCTPTCSRTCTLPPSGPGQCNGTCQNECLVGNVIGLNYSGSNLGVTLVWNSAANATDYLVTITPQSTGIPIYNNQSTSNATTFTFPVEVGESYTWTVKARNWCDIGLATAGEIIGVTDTDPDPNYTPATLNAKFYINYGQPNQCLNQGCNRKDIIVGFDDDHDRIIPIRVEISDANAGDAVPGKFTDIREFRVLFDNDEAWDPTLYRLIYTDDGVGNQNFTEENVGTNKYLNELEIRNINIDRYGDYKTLVIEFDLDLTSLPQDKYFLSNIYYSGTDFSGIFVPRTLVVGTGDTLEQPDDPYAPNSIDALDIWNGKDVAVKDVGFYQTSYENINLQSGDWKGTEILNGVGLKTTYSPPSTDWPSSLLNWNINTYYQPYFYYNGSQYIVYEPAPEASIILTGMNNLLYGGSVVGADANGRITNSFKNGGVRTGDSEVGDTSYETAFSVIQVSGGWSQIYDGSLFANSNFTLGIEPTTCTNCSLMSTLDSTNNGLLLVNGVIDAKDTVNYGEVTNWYAQTQSSIAPFNDFVIDKNYDGIKTLFAPDTFTELTTSSTIVDGNIGTDPLGPNQTYFVNGNLTILDNSLNVTDGNYLLFVVNGDLTIASTVKDVAEASAVEGMFIVFGDIDINDNASDNNDDLTIEGALVASGSINFNRSLYTNNNVRPPVKVVFRPDMLGKMAENKVSIFEIQKKLVSQY